MDILCNNADIGANSNAEVVSQEDWDETLLVDRGNTARKVWGIIFSSGKSGGFHTWIDYAIAELTNYPPARLKP
jgi:hypothetical protein